MKHVVLISPKGGGRFHQNQVEDTNTVRKMNTTEIAAETEFRIISFLSFWMQEKMMERIAGTMGTGMKKINPNPARCHGPQSPKIVNSKVSIPNNHSIPERIQLIIVPKSRISSRK